MSLEEYFGDEIRGRRVHAAQETFFVKLPALDPQWQWRLAAKMGIVSYWMPEVGVLLHCFNWVPEVQKSVAKVSGQAWESAHGYGLVVDQVHAFACSLLYMEFGGERLTYAFIHHFGGDLNDLGHAARRAVQAYESVLQRGSKALDEQVLAGGVRVALAGDAPGDVE